MFFRKLIVILFITGLLIQIMSCTDEWRRNKYSSIWNSNDPTTIPYNIRMKEFRSGNIVSNPSFEEGTPLASDTSAIQFIRKWEIVGDNVRYIENPKDSVVTPYGKRSVCIHRTVTDETLITGNGILSEFIPVIPGKYELSLKLKAMDVKPGKVRLGTKLFDAIHIRLQFFDDRKREIHSSVSDPLANVIFDQGFKGVSFSNFYSIDELPWSLIQARATNNQFLDGDIPANCSFVRIFIGLKGTGKILIDDVSFLYSKWNFTAKERMIMQQDSAFARHSFLIPTPQYFKPGQSISLISAGNDRVLYPAVVSDFPGTATSEYVKEYLSGEIKNSLFQIYPDCEIISGKTVSTELLTSSSVVFLLTAYENTDTTEFSGIIPGFSKKSQGYIIKDSVVNGKHIIILAARDEKGLFYGSSTISRLIDPVTGLMQNAAVIDFPFFQSRGLILHQNDIRIHNSAEIFDFAETCRFSSVYVPFSMTSGNLDIHSEQNRQFALSMYDYLKNRNTFESGAAFVRFNENISDDSLKIETDTILINGSTENKQFTELIQLISFLCKNECKYLFFQSSSVTEYFNIPQPAQVQKYVITGPEKFNLADEQAELMNNIFNWLKKNNFPVQIKFLPQWHYNESISQNMNMAEIYFRELNMRLNPEIHYAWSGNSVQSVKIDATDLKQYSDIAKPQFIFFENSWSTFFDNSHPDEFFRKYPGKLKLMNLFEPYDVNFPEEFFILLPDFLVNGHELNEINRIRFLTLSDFLWNPKKYQPEVSLWKILCGRYGKETSLQLLNLNDLYMKVLSGIIRMETAGKEKKSLLKQNELAIKKMNVILVKISQNTSAKLLAAELQVICNNLSLQLRNASKEKIKSVR